MSHLRRCSSTWHSGMVLCWSDRPLDGPVDGYSFEAVAKEFQMGLEAVARSWETSQDSCLVELWLHWHIGSSLCALPWRCYDSTGSGGVGAMPLHSRNVCATSGFMFLQSLTLLSLLPVLRMYLRLLKILGFFFIKMALQIWHFTLFSVSSTYQGVQLLTMPVVIVVWATTTLI
jgi:hypothetical protein